MIDEGCVIGWVNVDLLVLHNNAAFDSRLSQEMYEHAGWMIDQVYRG